MPSARLGLGSDMYTFCCHWFDSTRVQTDWFKSHDPQNGRQTLNSFGHAVQNKICIKKQQKTTKTHLSPKLKRNQQCIFFSRRPLACVRSTLQNIRVSALSWTTAGGTHVCFTLGNNFFISSVLVMLCQMPKISQAWRAIWHLAIAHSYNSMYAYVCIHIHNIYICVYTHIYIYIYMHSALRESKCAEVNFIISITDIIDISAINVSLLLLLLSLMLLWSSLPLSL